MGRERSAPRMGQPAHAAPFLRDSSAGGRRGFARGAGNARPQRYFHHSNIYSLIEEPFAQGSSQLSSAGDRGRFRWRTLAQVSNVQQFVVQLSIWAIPTVFAIILHEVM